MSREVRLSRRDETLVDLLIETGLSRNIAKTLVFLSKRDETTSVEIEKATGLRQPEVSIAMQELRRRKWVDKRDIKKEGKGRPVHSYRLSVSWSEILAQIDPEEQPVPDDAGDRGDPRRELRGCLDRPEPRIEEVVPVVRPHGLRVAPAQLDRRAEALQRRGGRLPAERMDLDGHGGLRPEARDELRLVDDHDEPLRRGRDYLLTEPRAPEALDQVELRVDLVGAVDTQVHGGPFLERRERDPQLLRHVRGRERRRHALQVHALPDEPGDALQEEPRGRAGPEPEDHPRLDVREGGFRGLSFQRVRRGNVTPSVGVRPRASRAPRSRAGRASRRAPSTPSPDRR